MIAQVDESSTRPSSESAIRTIVGENTQPPAVATERQLEAGTRVDRYVVLSMLGQGGMGVVYAAHDPMLDRGSQRAAALADGQGILALDRGQIEVAAAAFERAIAIADQLENVDDGSQCSMHDHLATAKFQLGDLDGAVVEYERAHELCARAFGTTHPRTASPLANPAQLVALGRDHALLGEAVLARATLGRARGRAVEQQDPPMVEEIDAYLAEIAATGGP